MKLLQWLRARDVGLNALRRATRTAIVMPAMFAIGFKVIGDANLATFAAFGSFALLLLVDFGGSLWDRVQAQVALAALGAVFVAVGTLASNTAWLSAVVMAAIAFVVLFSGVVSSVLAGASTALLLAFILPVATPAPASVIPARLEGWALASGASLLAITLLWPAPARQPLRAPAIAACRRIADRMRAEVALLLGQPGWTTESRDAAVEAARAALAGLQRAFFATPYRPTGLSTGNRTFVRLIDELAWLGQILDAGQPMPGHRPDAAVCAVKSAAADVLERGAELLDRPDDDGAGFADAQRRLQAAILQMEEHSTEALPVHRRPDPDGADRVTEFVSSLEPSFRAQETSYAISVIAANIELTVAAERRSWWARLLGRQPEGAGGTLTSVQERAAAHVERHSVSLHNSLRGAAALGIAVLIANLTGVQHSFWIVLGTLSVLRSNALSTGQNVLRGMLGTAAGVIAGGLLIWAIGTNTNVLWALLPIAIVVAGFAPAAISFAAGQAAFTITLVILFNITAPTGWSVGLIRVEDIAIGCAVSLAVGVLFWPRGAGSVLGQALAESYADCARYLRASVKFGLLRAEGRGDLTDAPRAERVGAAAAARRLDDAFRAFLAERGTKRVPLAEVTTLVSGIAGLRLAADAVLDMWAGEDGRGSCDTREARREIQASCTTLVEWYESFARGLVGREPVPDPLPPDAAADGRLIEALRRDLGAADGHTTATAVRMIWTGDHLDAARRLQAGLVAPARAAAAARAYQRIGTAGPHDHASGFGALTDRARRLRRQVNAPTAPSAVSTARNGSAAASPVTIPTTLVANACQPSSSPPSTPPGPDERCGTATARARWPWSVRVMVASAT